MRNYQFSKNPRGDVVGAKDRGLQMWSPLSLPGDTIQYGVRNRSKVWNAYIFSKNHLPTSWQTSMSLPAKISMSPT